MINASDYLEESSRLKSLVSMMFQSCIDSPIDLVRIAVNFNNYKDLRVSRQTAEGPWLPDWFKPYAIA